MLISGAGWMDGCLLRSQYQFGADKRCPDQRKFSSNLSIGGSERPGCSATARRESHRVSTVTFHCQSIVIYGL
jgi:hypothetical protein